MSSGLPVNTFSQAAEYRKRYMASLALEAQNDAYNLQANQVYKRTGQVSQLPDTRSTTEKLADIERLRVDLRAGLKEISDPISIEQTLSELDNDEVVFVTQQLPAIIADLKPQFIKGVPSRALLRYIRDLRRRFLQTNGVSFAAQEATAQQILNAIQAGVNVMGANGGPFAIAGTSSVPQTPVAPPSFGPEETPASPQLSLAEIFGRRRESSMPEAPPSTGKKYKKKSKEEKEAEAEMEARSWLDYKDIFGDTLTPEERPIISSLAPEVRDKIYEIQAREWLATSKDKRQPYDTLNVNIKDKISQLENLKKPPAKKDTTVAVEIKYRNDPDAKRSAEEYGPPSMEEWAIFPKQGAFGSYPDAESIAVQFLKWWADAQAPEIKDAFVPGWEKKRKLNTLKTALTPGAVLKVGMRPDTSITDIGVDPFSPSFVGKGIKPVPPSSKYRTLPIENRRVGNSPASRFPVGREILGYGLKLPQKQQKVKPIQLDMSKGLAYEASPTYVPFGKYAINPSKLSSGVFEMKTLKGGKVNKYPVRKLSPSLTKVMNRIISGRGIDDYDFNEMDLEDQNFLYDLTNDAKINDRIHLPTPKRSKDGEEENRFEILKGQIIAGNDNKDLIKEFKKMLVKFSDDGRIKKAEAREILMDLAAMGH